MQRGFKLISLLQWNNDKNKESIDYQNIKLPRRATSHSAGYDIFSTQNFTLEPDEEIKIPTGWKAYMQPDEYLMIVPRSGLGFKYYIRLANTVGIIDSDYIDNEDNEGHCWVKIRNEGNKSITIKVGEAIAQCLFQKYLLAEGDDFIGNKRYGGFGSTG